MDLSHRVAGNTSENVHHASSRAIEASFSLDPTSNSFGAIQRMLAGEKAFARRLTKSLLTGMRFQPGSTSRESWFNLGDLLIGFLNTDWSYSPVIHSTSALAVDPSSQPWILALRSYLRKSFTLESGGRPLTIDARLRLKEGSSDVLTIKNTQPPLQPFEIGLPDPVRQIGIKLSGVTKPQWQHLDDWLLKDPFFTQPVWSVLTEEWTSRQHRYRRLFSAYCAKVCSDCTSGGCCHSRYPKLIDIIAYRIQHSAFPINNQSENASCPFHSSLGCSLLPGPLPGVCVDFHCGQIMSSAPIQVRRLLHLLAKYADRVRQTFNDLWRHIIPAPPSLADNGWNNSVEAYQAL